MTRRFSQLFLMVIFTSMICHTVGATDFPYRQKYSKTPTIETPALYEQFQKDSVIIVDVRSTIEYNVIHPVGAIHIPVSQRGFVSKVTALSKSHPDKAIVFYCNGVTCLKSYVATQKAIQAGIKNCYAYDAGIPEWVQLYPDQTLLLGKPVVDPKTQIIPKNKFKIKCLTFKEFKKKAAASDAVVIDARDSIQKSGKINGLGTTLPIPFDKLIPNVIEKKLYQDKELLIFDQVGKQVRWLEYYLIENGYKNYYFLDGGATSVLKTQAYKQQ